LVMGGLSKIAEGTNGSRPCVYVLFDSQYVILNI